MIDFFNDSLGLSVEVRVVEVVRLDGSLHSHDVQLVVRDSTTDQALVDCDNLVLESNRQLAEVKVHECERVALHCTGLFQNELQQILNLLRCVIQTVLQLVFDIEHHILRATQWQLVDRQHLKLLQLLFGPFIQVIQ